MDKLTFYRKSIPDSDKQVTIINILPKQISRKKENINKISKKFAQKTDKGKGELNKQLTQKTDKKKEEFNQISKHFAQKTDKEKGELYKQLIQKDEHLNCSQCPKSFNFKFLLGLHMKHVNNFISIYFFEFYPNATLASRVLFDLEFLL